MACLGIFAPYTYLKSIRVGEGQLEHTEEVGLQYPQRACRWGELCTKSLEAAVEIGGSRNRMVPASTASLALALSATLVKALRTLLESPSRLAPSLCREDCPAWRRS